MLNFDISQLAEQNTWWIDRNNISKDNKIETLNKVKFKWDPKIRHFIKFDYDAIYTLRGPRQVGKTTLIKIIIKELLLNEKIKPENILFWSCEINSEEELHAVLQTYFNWRINNKDERKYIFLDEICSVKNWSREIIYFANKGDLTNCSIILTGSHSMDLKHSTELMPGRRGGNESNPLDKILLPMKFSEYVILLKPELKNHFFDNKISSGENKKKIIFEMFNGKMPKDVENLMLLKKQLDSLLESYLITGGIPSTINEYFNTDKISDRLYNVYITAMIGDLRRYNYKENNFKQIMKEIFNTLSTPISYNNFTKNTDIKSHNTIAEYITAFEELFIANISYRCSIDSNKIHTFNKKIYIQDPFIFHALHGWSNNKSDYFKNTKANVLNINLKSKLIESVVYSHLCRFAYGLKPRDLFDPKDNLCYYKDRNDKEVDFVLLFDDEYYPFEVKYQSSIQESDFVPFKLFKKGIIITKDELGIYKDYVKIPISIFLILI